MHSSLLLANNSYKPNFSDLITKDTIYINSINDRAAKLRFYNSDSLLILANEALKLSEELDYKYGISKALLQTANYYSDNGKSKKAVFSL